MIDEARDTLARLEVQLAELIGEAVGNAPDSKQYAANLIAIGVIVDLENLKQRLAELEEFDTE